jgi:hypothetical protein
MRNNTYNTYPFVNEKVESDETEQDGDAVIEQPQHEDRVNTLREQ